MLQEKHDKKPSSKKVNHLKYRVASPFRLRWDNLQMNWQCSSHEDFTGARKTLDSSFCVLRSRKKLDKLGKLFERKRCKSSGEKHENISQVINEIQTEVKSPGILVPVQIDMLSKGTPSDNAMICVPHMKDIEDLNKNGTHNGPNEPIKAVPKNQENQQKKDRPVSSKQNGKPVIHKHEVQSQTEDTSSTNKDSNSAITELNVPNIRWHCIRETAGFLVSGGFSLTCGHGRGVGFITLPALSVIAQQGHSTVLIRNTSSLQYRFARLSIFKSAIKLC